MSFSVRRLSEADAPMYFGIRLEGLRTEPSSFGATVEEDESFPEAQWRDWLANRSFTFGVFGPDGIAGVATYRIEAGAKASHRGHVLGVYVRPDARGTGAASLVMEAVMASARENVTFLYLQVTQSNTRAVRFYERLGFTIYGRDPGGLVVDGTMYEDYLMMLRLK